MTEVFVEQPLASPGSANNFVKHIENTNIASVFTSGTIVIHGCSVRTLDPASKPTEWSLYCSYIYFIKLKSVTKH